MGMNAVGFYSYLNKHLKYAIRIKDISIDTKVFQLHYRWTMVILLLFGGIVSVNQLFGKNIQCIKNTGGKVEPKVIDNYCWIEGTFVVARSVLDSIDLQIRNEQPHSGVVQYKDEDEIIETTYYQWVTIVLFMHAFSFLGPHYLWKKWEKRRQARMVAKLFMCIDKKVDMNKHKKILTHELYDIRGKNNAYAYRYFLCECLNLVNLIINAFMMNWFLAGHFWSYGWKSIDGSHPSPMVKVFPTMTKCTFHKFGPGGDVQKHDNLCILPINIVNEKGYLLVWWWFLFVFIITICSILYKVMMFSFPGLRYFMMYQFNRMIPKKYFHKIMSNSNYGDWFVIFLLSKNLDPFHFRQVMEELGRFHEFGPPKPDPEKGKEEEEPEDDFEDEEEQEDELPQKEYIEDPEPKEGTDNDNQPSGQDGTQTEPLIKLRGSGIPKTP